LIKKRERKMTIETTIKGVRVGYENYIFVHGTAPRGTGNWAFELNGEFCSYEGTFASARAQAVAVAVSRPGLLTDSDSGIVDWLNHRLIAVSIRSFLRRNGWSKAALALGIHNIQVGA
ncbi:MAG: hypothetical protein K2G99_00965, partial [Desulfovibrio sp.]|nr:hypothetical protein [Desulfovibrio sp.]